MKKKLLFVLLSLSVSSSAFAGAGETGIQGAVNGFFNHIVSVMAGVLFFEIPGFPMPLIVLVLACGGIFYTLRYSFVNVKMFRHSIDVIRGKYDNPDDIGQISHFQALTSALSATVGLGNIAGVAVAIAVGGPGAILWMWLAAFFGMSMKFSSCTFGMLYRKVDTDGHVLGGPMVYLEKGLKERFSNFPFIGKTFGVIFAIFTICGSFGGGNMFQANQTYELLSSQFPMLAGGIWPMVVGAVLAVTVAIVILGGISRIGEVTSKMVPFMCGFYICCCLAIIISNFSQVPSLFVSIFTQAISPEATFGGFVGVLIQGVKRASFSNEAGVGSAAIAHSAAKTDEPVREGIVAMIGPFIDTHLVCTMTALAILITGAHTDPELAGKGAAITAKAFASLGSIFPALLTIAVIVFAYSTIISWSYYGERAWEYLFGRQSTGIYKAIYVLIVFCGPLLSLGAVLDFSDLAILSMAFPNIIGMVFLASKLRVLLDDYVLRYKAGQMTVYK